MELPKVEIDWLNGNEISSSPAPFFAWASQSNRQASMFNTCRDRLNINARAGLYGQEYSSYRKPCMPPISYDQTRLLITGVCDNRQINFMKNGVPKLLELLHSAEHQIGMKHRTLMYEVSNARFDHKMNGGAYLLVSDSLWMRSTPMMSMFCLLIRISPGHTMGNHVMLTLDQCCKGSMADVSSGDREHVSIAHEGMKRIFKYGEKIWYPTPQENQPKNSTDSQIEEMGIKGFTKQYTKIAPAEYWHRDLEEKKEVAVVEGETARVVIAHEQESEAAA